MPKAHLRSSNIHLAAPPPVATHGSAPVLCRIKMKMYADLCSFLKPGSGTALFLMEKFNTKRIIFQEYSQEMNKGQDAPDKKGLSFRPWKYYKVLRPPGHTINIEIWFTGHHEGTFLEVR